MTNIIGQAIFEHRKKTGYTQDQFGKKINISGPAVFKFERGFVRPSLDVWLQIATDMNLDREYAVLMWMKDRLPDEFAHLIDLDTSRIKSDDPLKKSNAKYHKVDYSKYQSPEEVRAQAVKDKTLPRGLIAMMKDKKMWDSVKPTGEEVNFLRDAYQTVGAGDRFLFIEAISLHRKFMSARR